MALTDQLTGLPNRHDLHENFSQLQNTGLPLGAAMIDIANFGAVNRNLGHHMGDRVLRYSGVFIQNNVRQDDSEDALDKVLVNRQGGDEFVIFAVLADRDRRPVSEHKRAKVMGNICLRLAYSYRHDSIISTYNAGVEPDEELSLLFNYALYVPNNSLEDLLAAADPKCRGDSAGLPKNAELAEEMKRALDETDH